MHTHPFLTCKSFQKLWMYGEIYLHLSSFSVKTHSLISLRITSFEVSLGIRLLENILDSAKLKASVYRSSLDGKVTIVVSVLSVEGVDGTARAVDGPVSSAHLTLDGVECFTCIRISSSELDIMSTLWNFFATLWKLFKFLGDCFFGWFKAKSEWGMFAVSIWVLEFELFGANLLIVLSFSVIAKYSWFRRANSLHNLLMECVVFEACFVSGFRAAKLMQFSAFNKKRFALRLITSILSTMNCSS